jgi:hypothetical protein
MTRLFVGILMLMSCAGMVGGCAATGQNVPLQLKPAVVAAGSRGEVLIALNGSSWVVPEERKYSRYAPKFAPMTVRPVKKRAVSKKITLVKVMDDNGMAIGNRILPVYSGDILVDSLIRELTGEGYTAKLVRKLPDNVDRGIDVSIISSNYEQYSRFVALEMTGRMRVRIDVRKKGKSVGTGEYLSELSDYALVDKNDFPLNFVHWTAEEMTAKCLPEILAGIENGTSNNRDTRTEK